MNRTIFRCTAVLTAVLAATACAQQESGDTVPPPRDVRGQGDVSPANPLPSRRADAVEQGVDPATPVPVPAPGTADRPTVRPPAEAMPVPEELYPVDPAPTPPPER